MYKQQLLGFTIFPLIAFSTPIVTQLFKRYDIDCNGTPDWCYTDGSTVHCLLADGLWTTFPGTSTPTCATSGVSVTVISSKTTASLSSTRSSTTKSSSSKKTTHITTTTTCTHSSSSTNTPPTTSTPCSANATAQLPSPSQFTQDKSHKWTFTFHGTLTFTDPITTLALPLTGDKCRTSRLGGRTIWSCGDMQCGSDWRTCGFSLGPAFYGTDSVLLVNTSGVANVQDNDFVQAWSGDEPPSTPQWAWGMDTSNVAAINETHGVVYAWEIWRGAADGSHVDRGNAVASVTLGDERPVARRVGGLLTGPDRIALGLLAVLRDGEYVYTYSVGGPSGVIVGRVKADDSVFDSGAYEFLKLRSNNTWVPGIPKAQGVADVGMSRVDGQFGCSVYGSVFFNTYLRKYILLCSIFMKYVNMYISDTPYGPWSAEYSIATGGQDGMLVGGYGAMAHPAFGDGREWYFSIGPNSVFQVFKVEFGY